jgi:single-strand DNA-binding protein
MVNKTTLIGRVGNAPEVIKLESSNAVVTFSLATSEKFKDKQGNRQEVVEWHNIVIWGKLAEIVEKYVEKGSLLYLEGKNKTRSWEKDGIKHYKTEVVCTEMQMLGGKSESKQSQITPPTNDLPY